MHRSILYVALIMTIAAADNSCTWVYDYCYIDQPGNRLLRGIPGDGGINEALMTVEYCQEQCLKRGFRLAGVEFGSYCFCDNKFAYTPSPSLGCKNQCPGNLNQICGGSNTIAVYRCDEGKKATKQCVWKYRNCTRENPNDRYLYGTGGAGNPLGDMTITRCHGICASLRYKLAGLGYGNNCFCANDGSYPATGSNSCNLPCNGNPAQICGGSDALSIYECVMSPFEERLSDVSTNEQNNGEAIGGGPFVDSGRNSDPARLRTNGNEGGRQCYWSTPICYGDNIDGQRLLLGSGRDGINQADMTIERCTNLCDQGGYTYAGLEFGTYCFCGNRHEFIPIMSNRCNHFCAGASTTQLCGGQDAISVLSCERQPPDRSRNDCTWQYRGCWQDREDRILNAISVIQHGLMTIDICKNVCLNAGYTLAGVENAYYCMCGNSYAYSPRPSDRCNVLCAGNNGQYCGGIWAINVYECV